MSAVLGINLIVSDNAALIGSLLANVNRKVDASSAVFIAGFNHARERKFLWPRSTVEAARPGRCGRAEHSDSHKFFSENIASLKLNRWGAVRSEEIVVRAADDRVFNDYLQVGPMKKSGLAAGWRYLVQL